MSVGPLGGLAGTALLHVGHYTLLKTVLQSPPVGDAKRNHPPRRGQRRIASGELGLDAVTCRPNLHKWQFRARREILRVSEPSKQELPSGAE